jgi:hypothetical protein
VSAVREAQLAGLLCGCGDRISDPADGVDIPLRDDGSARGVCHCYRRRLREKPR